MIRSMLAVLPWLLLAAVLTAFAAAGSETPVPTNNPVFPIIEKSQWGFVDQTGAKISAADYDDFLGSHGSFDLSGIGVPSLIRWMQEDPLRDPLIGVRRGKQWGFVSRSGRLVVPFQFEDASRFSGGLAAVKKDGLWGFIDTTGAWVLSPRYESAGGFYGPLAVVTVGGKDGLIRRDGSYAVQPEWDAISSWPKFSDNRQPVVRNGKIGYVDGAGRTVIAPRYDAQWGGVTGVEDFREGLAHVYVGGKHGYIDTLGQMVIAPQFDNAWRFSSGRALVERKGKLCVIDRTGRTLETLPFEINSMLDDEHFAVRHKDKLGVMDVSGRVIVPVRFDELGAFCDGLAPARLGKKNGFVDRTGTFVHEVPYSLGRISEGLATASLGTKHGWILGFVDTSGTLVIPPRFREANEFSDGLAWAMAGDTIGYVDKHGRWAWFGRFPEMTKSLAN